MRNHFGIILLVTLINSFLGNTQIVSDKKMVDIFAVNFSNGTLPIKKNGKWGLVDSNNIVKVNIIYDSIFAGGEGLCILKKDDRYSFINERFETVLKGKDLKIDVIKYSPTKSKLAVTRNDITEYYLSENGVLNKFYNDDSLNSYLRESFIENNFQNTFKDLNLGIDSVSKVFENDSISLIIHYINREQLKTEKAKLFKFEAPFFITYTVDEKLHFVNLKNRQVTTTKFKVFSNSFEIKDSVYYVASEGNNYEVIELETGKSYVAKSNVNQFGELIYTNSSPNKNTAEIVHLQSRRTVLSNLNRIEIYKGYLICVDSNNISMFLSETGEVFYSENADSIRYHQNFITESNLESKNENKLVQIFHKNGGELLVSTGGKIYNYDNYKFSYNGDFTIRLVAKNVYPNIKVGIYDPNADSLYTYYYEQIKFIKKGVWLVKTNSNMRSESLWLFIDEKGNCINENCFNTCDVSRFPNSNELIIRGIRNDTVYFYDKDLNLLNLNFNKNIKLFPIATMHYEWTDSNSSFLRCYDTNSKTFKGLIDSNLNVITLEEFNSIFFNPKADYFFLLQKDGEFSYSRGNGKQL